MEQRGGAILAQSRLTRSLQQADLKIQTLTLELAYYKRIRFAHKSEQFSLIEKCASDAGTLEHAQQLLAHANGSTTKRIYRRKTEHIKPLR